MKEEDIRKRETHARYLELVQKDCEDIIQADCIMEVSACPACGTDDIAHEFRKSGFDYGTCTSCGTLYARTRLPFDKLKQFYSQSASTTFWVKEFFTPFAEARREKIFKPRAEFVSGFFGKDPMWLIGDVGAGFGFFLSELRKCWPESRYMAIEPSLEQATICRNKGLQVECCVLEELAGYEAGFDMLTAFELFEHLYNPGKFLSDINRLLKQGGRLLLTTLNGEGFDLQLLWQDSGNIYPPCHINFFNPQSLCFLLGKKGFYVESVETPGQLDWDIVEGAMKAEKGNVGRFWKLLARKGTIVAKRELQDWISRNKLSSHMRILARKNKDLLI